jgi:hypothetical protein
MYTGFEDECSQAYVRVPRPQLRAIGYGAFIFRAVLGIDLAPITRYVAAEKYGSGIPGAFKRR